MINKDLQIIFDEFNEKPIVYNRIYSKITWSITAWLLLSQLVYWSKTMNYKEFYKTDDDFSNELWMWLYELKSAKKRLQELEIINIIRKWIPAKSFYTVNIDRIITLISSCGKNQQLDNGKTNNLSKEKPITITEITSEITSESNSLQELEQSSEIIKIDKRDLDIDLIIETLKEINMWVIDDPVKKQRQYWKLIKDKLNKIKWFNWDYVLFIKYCYDNNDEYRKNHFRSLEKFYYNIANIVTWVKMQAETKQKSKITVC